MDSEIPEELIPCSNCGRTFVKSSLDRHYNICTKNKNDTQHRQKFDSSKQRIQGTELEQYLPTPVIKPPTRPRSRSVPGGNRRGSTTAAHEQCQYCGRSFSDKAIDRHREWCQSHNALRQQQPVSTNSPAYERMQARTKYRAPMAKSLRAKTREKYSPAGVSSSKEVPVAVSSPAAKTLITKRASLPDTSPAKSVIYKRASLPDTRRPKENNPHAPPKRLEDKYDVFLSAERQLKELGLLNASNSPVLSRRGLSSPSTMREELASPRQSTPDVFLSAERQLKELGVFNSPNSPLLNRRELPFPSNAGEEVESLQQTNPSPAVSLSQLHSKSPSITSTSNSRELLIIEDDEDEEEYLINQLAADTPPKYEEQIKPEDKVTPTTSDDLESHTDLNYFNLNDNNTFESPHDNISNNNYSLFEDHKSKSSKDEDNLPSHFVNDSKQFDIQTKEKEINNLSYFSNNTSTSEAELLFNSLKQSLERPDVTKENECPLTESLKYLDAALSLFQLEDIPSRPSDAPRSKASTKRRLYSTASPLSLLTPDPDLLFSTTPSHDDKCLECGSPFPVPSARFCCLCGTRRPLL